MSGLPKEDIRKLRYALDTRAGEDPFDEPVSLEPAVAEACLLIAVCVSCVRQL